MNKSDFKNHINQILAEPMTKIDSSRLPKSDNISFNNYSKTWATAISVDIRSFKKLCDDYDTEEIIRLTQSFSSSLIRAMKKNDNFRECFVNGDEVIGVFECATKGQTKENHDTAILCNSIVNYLLPTCLKENGYMFYGTFKCGVGIYSSSDNAYVRYGQKGSPEDSYRTFIGSVINKACLLGKYANKRINYTTHDQVIMNQLVACNLEDGEKYKENEINIDGVGICYEHSYRYNDYVE